jgi:hypothetical protein
MLVFNCFAIFFSKVSQARKAELSGQRAAGLMQFFVKVSSCLMIQQGYMYTTWVQPQPRHFLVLVRVPRVPGLAQ